MIDLCRIPTALSEAESAYLQRFAEGMRVVECGALLGFSTRLMAETAKSVLSIDKHCGYGPSTLNAFLSNVSDKKDVIIPVIGDAIKLLPFLDVDRYFLDLDGTFETTQAALSAIPRYGQPIAVHDFRRQNCSGVERAILESGYHICEVVDSLVILKGR